MRHRILFFLAVSGLLGGFASGADWIPLKQGAAPGSTPTVRVLSSTTQAIQVEVTVPGFWAEKTPYGWRVRLPQGLPTMDEGRPELSFLACTLALPNQALPTVHIRSATWVLPRSLKIRMAPKPELEGEHHLPPPPAAPGLAYPSAQVEVAHHGLWRTIPLVTLRIHPFQAKGDGTLLGVAARMVFDVNPANPPASWPSVVVPEEFLALAKSTVANFSFLPSSTTPPVEPMASTTEYLVIANSSLASGVTNLINWRKRQGYKTELVVTSSTSPTTIKGYIQSRFSGGHLKYVVLVGDYAQIPWYYWSGDRSDMWYACLTGGSNPDLYPDVGLGRLSGTSASQIAHQVAKILKYEQNPPSGSWFTKTILAAHRQGAPGKYVGCSEQIAHGPLGSSGWTIIKQYGNNSSVSNTTVSNYINGGVGLVNYRGHGSTTEWANGWNTHSGGYSVSYVNALHNGDMTPIVFNIACYNGNFQYSTCLQEAWLRANDAAVASLGATQPSYTTPNHEFDKELYRAIFQDKLTNIYSFWYKGVVKLVSMGTYGKHNARMYWWAGDGRTNLWSKAPTYLTVYKPTSLTVGSHTVSIVVKSGSSYVSGARVCLYKGTEVFAVGYTGSTGRVNLSVHPTTPGTMLVTVTAKDRRPYQGSITITPAVTRIPPRFLSALNITVGSNYNGQLWITDGNRAVSRRVTLPSLFNTTGINALLVTTVSTTTGTIYGYLSTIKRGTSVGDVYYFNIKPAGSGYAMTYLRRLNTTAFSGGNLAQLYYYRGRIYTVHQNSSRKGAVISSVPTGGGPVKIEKDLTTVSGFQGIGNAMAGIGSDLYVATWNSASGGQEQLWRWSITTHATAKVGVLPKTLSTGSFYGPVNLQVYAGYYLVAIGVYGDVAWIRKTNGSVYRHYHTGTWNASRKKYNINLLNSGCINYNTYDWWLGSRDAALDVLSRSHGANQVALLGASRAASVTAIAYLRERTGYAYCYGDGGKGTGGFYPVQVYLGTPHLNMWWRLRLYGAPGHVPAILGFGASRTQWGPLRLPFDLGPLGAPGNFIRSAFDVAFGWTTSGSGAGKGKLYVMVRIPNNPTLIGGWFYTQWLIIDRTANPLGVTMSNAYMSRIYR